MWTSWPEEREKLFRVHVDLCGPFYDGSMALVMVDAFTKWPEVHLLKSTTSNDIIKRLRRTFSQEGVPATLVSYNGPQFASVEICRWLAAINCEHVRTPPYHPRSNGLAEHTERFVRTLKDHIRTAKQGDLQSTVDRFLLQYRNARHATTGQAPAFLMRNHLPHSPVVSLWGQTIWARKYSDKK